MRSQKFKLYTCILFLGFKGTSLYNSSHLYLLPWGFPAFILPVPLYMSHPSPRPWFTNRNNIRCRSKRPRGLRRRSVAARLLRLWVRITTGAWMSFVSVVCCQVEVSATGWSEESYRLWCVVVCDIETSEMRRPWPTRRCRAKNKTLDE